MAAELTISRDGVGPIRYSPDFIELGPEAFGLSGAETGHFYVIGAAGWGIEPIGPLRWRVTPYAVNLDREARFTLLRDDGARTISVADVHVCLDLRSSFDPASCAFHLPNRAEAIGEVDPDLAIFDRTFLPMPAALRRLLYRGIYSDIVFLHAEGRHGGLCSGMARWAIARGRGDEPPPASDAVAVDRIRVFHGRQMSDRALLAALPWFLRGSPRAAFRAVRRDFLRHGRSERALDIGVPKLWRRDVTKALVAIGHTVVPYRLHQAGSDSGGLEIYDPNHPESLATNEPRFIPFDLRRNRYEYGRLATMDRGDVGMIAAPESAYLHRGTAILATIGPLLFTPKRGWRSLVGKQ